MKRDSLGDRMKRNYEDISRIKLTRRTPVIVRLDGKAFHTLTRSYDKPFDHMFIDHMVRAAETLFKFIGGNLKLAYVQSDEVSLLLTDWDKLTTEAFFDYNIQKLVSTVASQLSVSFSIFSGRPALFDARAFNIPKEEVCNYFIWRQQDWMRNSVQMLGQKYMSHNHLNGMSQERVKEELLTRFGVSWLDMPDQLKYGTCIEPGETGPWVEDCIPIFSENRHYIEDCLLNL